MIKNISDHALRLLGLLLLIAGLAFVNAALAQGNRTAQQFAGTRKLPAQDRRAASSDQQNKIDRAKPTRGCNGNFIRGHRIKSETDAVVMDANLLQREYDREEIRRRALSQNYKVADDRPFALLRVMSIEEFNREHSPQSPIKYGDRAQKLGALKVEVVSATHVEISGRVLEVSKAVAPREEFSIRIEYEIVAPGKYPQQISVTQAGRCNLRDTYIRTKAKELLTGLGLETDWVDTTEVSVNHIN